MLPNLYALLRRDLHTNPTSFALPGLVALLCSLSMLQARQNPMMLLVLSLWVAMLIPHALHLREEQQGTLGDLAALPVRAIDVVVLRILEGMMAATLVVLVHSLVLLIAQGWNGFKGLSGLLTPGWLWMVLLFLALPLPITLRWGSRGWIALILSVFLLFGGLVLLNQGEGDLPGARWCIDAMIRTVTYCSRHPFQHALILVVLCTACLPVAALAYRHRDL